MSVHYETLISAIIIVLGFFTGLVDADNLLVSILFVVITAGGVFLAGDFLRSRRAKRKGGQAEEGSSSSTEPASPAGEKAARAKRSRKEEPQDDTADADPAADPLWWQNRRGGEE